MTLTFGDESVSFDVFAPGFVLEFSGVVDVYAGSRNYGKIAEIRILFEKKFFSSDEVASVQAFVDEHRLRKFAGAVSEIGLFDDPFAVFANEFESFDRLDCADEHSLRIVFRRGDDIQAEVHPVDHIDLSVTSGKEHRLGSFGASAAESVAALVGDSAVGLGLDDFCNNPAVFGLPDKIVTEKIFGDNQCAAHEKRCRKTHENSVQRAVSTAGIYGETKKFPNFFYVV